MLWDREELPLRGGWKYGSGVWEGGEDQKVWQEWFFGMGTWGQTCRGQWESRHTWLVPLDLTGVQSLIHTLVSRASGALVQPLSLVMHSCLPAWLKNTLYRRLQSQDPHARLYKPTRIPAPSWQTPWYAGRWTHLWLRCLCQLKWQNTEFNPQCH
jgi:hypothetical protein